MSKDQIGPWLAGYASACRVLRRLVISNIGVTKRSMQIRKQILEQYRLVLRWCELKWGDEVTAIANQKENVDGGEKTEGKTSEH